MGQVVEVNMVQRDGPGPAVKASGRKNTVGEVVCEEGVVFKKFL